MQILNIKKFNPEPIDKITLRNHCTNDRIKLTRLLRVKSCYEKHPMTTLKILRYYNLTRG